MKIRTQLLLAFLLLAVLPMSAIVLFSYYTSLRAVRDAVEAEAEILTADMEDRMVRVTSEAQRRVERIGRLPLRRLVVSPNGTGDALLLMSDGLPELPNSEEEPLGYERASELFGELATAPLDEIISRLGQGAMDWVGGEAPSDDITLVVLRVT
jgi:hypothetical protein